MKKYYEEMLKLREDLSAFKEQTSEDIAEKDI
jgi:hypothetical protein